MANLFGHVWTCLNKSPTVFCGHISKTCNRKKIKVYSIRKSFFFQLYNNFTISIACDKIEAKKQNFCISSQKYIQQFSSIKYYSRSKYEKYEKKTTTQWKKSQCPPVFKTIRNKNQKTKNTTALEKTWIVDAYHYENNQQQKLEEKNKQAEKPIKKSISSFLDLLKNYYHYFVQPEPEKSIMLVYNYIYIQKTELSKQNKNILRHTRENYAYNDHDLVTRPLPMNFECRNNSNL